MKIVLLSDQYYPQRTSCAVQMRDLAYELLQLGHEPIVITPSENLDQNHKIEKIDRVQVLRVAVNKTTNVSHFKRGLNELMLPFKIINGIKKSNLPIRNLDAVIWYSPTIFFGPTVQFLKRLSGCPTYLILRDIFPEWALDLGILKKNPVYYFLKIVARYQYSVANIIGVQTFSNLKYLVSWSRKSNTKLEVLNNWLSSVDEKKTKISLTNTHLDKKKLFVYVGNMGVAQGMDIFIKLAESLNNRQDLGFLFVGRGSEVVKLKDYTIKKKLNNILFFDEINSDEIQNLLKMCHVGLIALDPQHKSHNIPGKFLSYLKAGLPILARVNPGTDLQNLIEQEKVGVVYSGNKVNDLRIIAEKLINDKENLKAMSDRGPPLCQRMFSTNNIANQIISSLSNCR
jgi:glycosyltransferase involved in cell wall biosynthesis